MPDKKSPQRDTHSMEAVKQCVGHGARRTLVAFHVGGVGIHLKSTLLELSLQFIFRGDNTYLVSGMETGHVPACRAIWNPPLGFGYRKDIASCPFPADNNKSVPIGMQELFRLVCADDKVVLGLHSSSVETRPQMPATMCTINLRRHNG